MTPQGKHPERVTTSVCIEYNRDSFPGYDAGEVLTLIRRLVDDQMAHLDPTVTVVERAS